MSFLYLPKELIKYTFEYLNDEDYVATQLTCKSFTSVFNDIEKKAMWDVETAVKYKQDRHLSKFDSFELEYYATVYNRLELIKCEIDSDNTGYHYHLSSKDYVDIRLDHADKTTYKNANIDKILEVAFRYNARKVVDVMLNHIAGDFGEYVEMAAAYNNIDLAEYLLQYNRNGCYVSRISMCLSEVCTYDSFEWIYAKHSNVNLRPECLLILDPRITERITTLVRGNLTRIIHSNWISRIKFNRDTIRNLEILNLDRRDAGELLKHSIDRECIFVCKWLVQKYDLSASLVNSVIAMDKRNLYYLEMVFLIKGTIGVMEKMNCALLSDSDQMIRIFNRFPQLIPYFNNIEYLTCAAREKKYDIHCLNVIYNLAPRTPEDILSCLKSCKDEKKRKYLLDEFKRRAGNEIQLLMETGECINDSQKRQLLYRYLDSLPIDELLNYFRCKKE